MAKKSKPDKSRRVDRRAMESASAKIAQLMKNNNFASIEEANKFLMEQFCGSSIDEIDYEPQTPLEQAQFIIWDAFEEPSKKRRIEMAAAALKISADCADAYTLLAEDAARDIDEEIDLYQKGVEAGRRALGEKVLNDPQTSFWGELSTRPYMRAMNGLASALYSNEEYDAAITLWQELLQLNPRDNQGIRYLLAVALVHAGRLQEAEKHSNMHDEDSPYIMYSRALCLFKMHGDSRQANDALFAAIECNPHVIEILVGARKLLKNDPPSYSPGSVEEAHCYISMAIESWIEAKDAVDWIADVMGRELATMQLQQTFPGNSFNITRDTKVVDLNSYRLQ